MAYFHTTVLDEQIKALPTVDTASGSIASFNTDLTENLVDVKCQIVAKQASGTPSPVNPLPITTYTEMNVSATGKNILDNTLLYTYSNWNRDLVTVGDYPTNNVNRGYALPTKNGITYTISFGISADSFPTYLYLCKTDGVTSSRLYALTSSSFNDNKYTFTADGSMYYLRLGSTGSETNFNNQMALCSYAQLEKGTTATTYEPFGTTANIPFGQTVANGVLDIGSGKLRVTHKIVDLGTLDWTYDDTSFSSWAFFYADIPDRGGDWDSGICSKYVLTSSRYARNEDKVFNFTPYIGLTKVNIRDTAYTDAVTFKTAMNGAQLVYELATPIEIQLDSITLQALLNENNIWCDTGDTEVKFLLTVGKKIS